MSVKYGKFRLPSTMDIEEVEGDPSHVRISAGPFERGFGTTVGVAIRRTLLSSIESPAVVSMRLGLGSKNAVYEYTTIEGIKEDVPSIGLNIKETCVSVEDGCDRRESFVVMCHCSVGEDDLKNGEKAVSLGDLVIDDRCEHQVNFLDPDHVLFTVTKPIQVQVDLRIAFGRGYTFAKDARREGWLDDEIALDVMYSPVRTVNYFVSKVRVGHDVDFDQLILEVKTDGRVSPKKATLYAAQILQNILTPFCNMEDEKISFEEETEKKNIERSTMLSKLRAKIHEVELTVRARNCLQVAQIETFGQLIQITEADLLRFRNFGQRSLLEIKEVLRKKGLTLGMNLAPYHITQEEMREMFPPVSTQDLIDDDYSMVDFSDMPNRESDSGDQGLYREEPGSGSNEEVEDQVFQDHQIHQDSQEESQGESLVREDATERGET